MSRLQNVLETDTCTSNEINNSSSPLLASSGNAQNTYSPPASELKDPLPAVDVTKTAQSQLSITVPTAPHKDSPSPSNKLRPAATQISKDVELYEKDFILEPLDFKFAFDPSRPPQPTRNYSNDFKIVKTLSAKEAKAKGIVVDRKIYLVKKKKLVNAAHKNEDLTQLYIAKPYLKKDSKDYRKRANLSCLSLEWLRAHYPEQIGAEIYSVLSDRNNKCYYVLYPYVEGEPFPEDSAKLNPLVQKINDGRAHFYGEMLVHFMTMKAVHINPAEMKKVRKAKQTTRAFFDFFKCSCCESEASKQYNIISCYHEPAFISGHMNYLDKRHINSEVLNKLPAEVTPPEVKIDPADAVLAPPPKAIHSYQFYRNPGFKARGEIINEGIRSQLEYSWENCMGIYHGVLNMLLWTNRDLNKVSWFFGETQHDQFFIYKNLINARGYLFLAAKTTNRIVDFKLNGSELQPVYWSFVQYMLSDPAQYPGAEQHLQEFINHVGSWCPSKGNLRFVDKILNPIPGENHSSEKNLEDFKKTVIWRFQQLQRILANTLEEKSELRIAFELRDRERQSEQKANISKSIRLTARHSFSEPAPLPNTVPEKPAERTNAVVIVHRDPMQAETKPDAHAVRQAEPDSPAARVKKAHRPPRFDLPETIESGDELSTQRSHRSIAGEVAGSQPSSPVLTVPIHAASNAQNAALGPQSKEPEDPPTLNL